MSFSGRLSEMNDRLAFADLLTSTFVASYTNDVSFAQMQVHAQNNSFHDMNYRYQQMQEAFDENMRRPGSWF